MREYELTYTNDCVIQACNYSILAAEMGKFDQAIELLQACMRAVAERYPERNSDYAMLQEAMGSIYLAMGNVPKSIQYFRKRYKAKHSRFAIFWIRQARI